jgi:hypothetical protein
MKDKNIVCLGIGGMITVLEMSALYCGINGILFTGVISSLVGIFGYTLGHREK